jgi:hypothetical protein
MHFAFTTITAAHHPRPPPLVIPSGVGVPQRGTTAQSRELCISSLHLNHFQALNPAIVNHLHRNILARLKRQ